MTEEDLKKHRAGDRVRELVRFQVARTRGYFEAGLPLIDQLSGHLRIDVALFSRGGWAILDKIEQQDYDTLSTRPTLSNREKLGLFLSTVLSRKRETWTGR